ncbi:NUDIX hydrolase [Flavihumibacter sp. R14]|nr:NUDIX hydrolase [Flavihumibacter soli]
MSETENPWQVISSREVYNNPWINLTEHQVINPGGGKGIYGMVHFKNLAIGIVVLDEQHHTWLVGQYRFALDEYSWEIPAGGGSLDSDPLETAKRELLEETGISANHWTEIQRMHLSNSVSDELAIIYLARELTFGSAAPEETEQLQVKKLPLDEAYGMVTAGRITDSLSVAGLLKLKLMKAEGNLL